MHNLTLCFIDKKQFKQEKEEMWGAYHLYRSSQDFHQKWIDFVDQAIKRKPSPTFYQFFTHEVFKTLLKMRYPDSSCSSSTNNDICLTREEENALHYVAGYVVRKIRNNLEPNSDSSKHNMILCIMEMYGDEWDKERGTEDWTNLIDRGGLWHINDQAYDLFYVIEQEVRTHFVPTARALVEMSTLVNAVLNNEDVLFHWSMLAADTADADTNKLIKMIVELYSIVKG